MEDAQADLEQDQQRLVQELGQKIMVVVDKYAKDNSFTLVLDVSSPQTPVLYASNTIDITKDIVDLYDKNSAAMAPSTVGQAPAKPAPGTSK
jgi:outer membrane protein